MTERPPSDPATASASNGARYQVRRFRVGLFARLKAYFFAGILVTAPVAITAAVAIWFINMVDAQIVPLIPERWNPDTYLREHVGLNIGLPGLGLLVLVSAITLIGAFAAGLIGRIVVRAGDSVLARMPVIRTVYGASKQILETVLRNQSNAFRQAVMIEYPRRGLWTIGFITGETQGEAQALTDDKVFNVFIPTTPNPTSGFLLFVPERDITILQMSVEEAVKLIISGGIVVPPDRSAAAPSKVPPPPELSRIEG